MEKGGERLSVELRGRGDVWVEEGWGGAWRRRKTIQLSFRFFAVGDVFFLIVEIYLFRQEATFTDYLVQACP